MQKYRIIKHYYRGKEQEILHHFKIEELKIEELKEFKTGFWGQKLKTEWKPLCDEYLSKKYSWNYTLRWKTLKEAKQYLKNITTPLPPDEIIKR